MESDNDPVSEYSINYDEVFQRGGRNLGDEDFSLFKCPSCGQVYLIDCEVGTIYFDGGDLSRRTSADIASLTCIACGERFPANEPWVGERSAERFRVRWGDLFASAWSWVALRGLTPPTARTLPLFNDIGYLPPGVHRASLAEVIERFGRPSPIRREQAQSIEWLLPVCRAAGIARLIINGSFVTSDPQPNDVDCVLLQGRGYDELSIAAAELEQGLPFLSLQIVRQEAFDHLVDAFFATDRYGAPKGIVEIPL